MTTLPDDPVVMVVLAAALGAVVLLLAGWQRARRANGAGQRIELLTSRYLGGKKVLTLVDVEGERLLLALSGNSVRLIARLGSRRPPAAERHQPAAQLLQEARHGASQAEVQP